MSDPPVPELPAAVPASSAKRRRQSSPAKRSKHRTDEAGEKGTELIEPPQAGCAESQAEDRLSSLPPELQAAILGNLDIRSIHSLYAAGYHGLQALAAGCHFSANSTLTAKSLTSSFFVSASGYLRKLDLSGVPNLNLPTLLNALSRMKNLNNLDVSYTNVTMKNFLRIVKVRPTLRTIAINFILNFTKKDIFDFRKLDNPVRPMSDKMLMSYQQAFARFEEVHFVGALQEYILGALASLMLEKANLSSLKYTVVHDGEEYMRCHSKFIKLAKVTLAQFQMYFLRTPDVFHLQIFTTMDIQKYEILLFILHNERQCDKIQEVYATKLVSEMIFKGLGVQVSVFEDPVSLHELQYPFSERYSSDMGFQYPTKYDTAVFFWNRERTDFDSAFSSNLLTIFKEHFVFEVIDSEIKIYNEYRTPAAVDGKWFSEEHCLPWPRRGPPEQRAVELDHGAAYKHKRDVKLRILFIDSLRPQTLVNKCGFFKKLSHLCLCDQFELDADFFKDVFSHCESLTTLELMTHLSCDVTSLRYLKESKTLKNILIWASRVDMATLFAHLSECRTLGNICLSCRPTWPQGSTSANLSCLPDPSGLFGQCVHLYSVYIHLKISWMETDQYNPKGMLKFYKSVMSDLGRDALTLVISTERVVQYHTHLGVFKFFNSLVPIKS